MMDNASRLADVMRRPGMYGIATVEHAMMFVGGFDAATELPGSSFPGSSLVVRNRRGSQPDTAWSGSLTDMAWWNTSRGSQRALTCWSFR